eukprot:TRINITY_DN26355_c0_g1_i1.p1 TRINITY_DN26355_c0_g1~~TRINITY_DN26355_c0_g1_i1.p1  ORF type:complete len:173 (-),score=9.36 TRINITY_DN26355_c0_g1_i1:77-595(-)
MKSNLKPEGQDEEAILSTLFGSAEAEYEGVSQSPSVNRAMDFDELTKHVDEVAGNIEENQKRVLRAHQDLVNRIDDMLDRESRFAERLAKFGLTPARPTRAAQLESKNLKGVVHFHIQEIRTYSQSVQSTGHDCGHGGCTYGRGNHCQQRKLCPTEIEYRLKKMRNELDKQC